LNKPLFGGQRVYHRPPGPSTLELLVVALIGTLVLLTIELRPWSPGSAHRDLARTAAEHTQRAFDAIREERLRRDIPLLPELDPARSGLIFRPATSITTSSGALSAKQTSVNPNFAALILAFYLELGLKQGDVIALGVTGSFPAWNIAALVAAEELGLRPIVIASAAASDYGASDEKFSWLDMATFLNERGLLKTKTLAASLGGLEDLGGGLSEEGTAILEAAIERSGAERLRATSYEESLAERLAAIERARAGAPLGAYVNIGGGAVSFGRSRAQGQFQPGINLPSPDVSEESVMGALSKQGIPVIHLVQAVELATRYGLPLRPHVTPAPGAGSLFRRSAPSPLLPVVGLGLLSASLALVALRAKKRRELTRLAYNPLTDSAPSRHARPPSRPQAPPPPEG
jgi:poly-gamma-glutamate system protein